MKREDKAVILLDVLLELLSELDELRGFLHILFVVGFEDLVALELAIGQTGIGRRDGVARLLGA